MNCNWLDFLSFAKKLHTDPILINSSPDASFRTVVSRAYYAAFHFACAVAEKDGFCPEHFGQDHGKVRSFLKGTAKPDNKREKACEYLYRLYRMRTKADYEDELPANSNFKHFAINAINEAERVINSLK